MQLGSCHHEGSEPDQQDGVVDHRTQEKKVFQSFDVHFSSEVRVIAVDHSNCFLNSSKTSRKAVSSARSSAISVSSWPILSFAGPPMDPWRVEACAATDASTGPASR